MDGANMNSDLLLYLLLVSLPCSDCSLTQFVTVREGEDAILSCGNVSSSRCDFDWHFLDESRSILLFHRGQRVTEEQTGADLLKNCSMIFKNVTRKQLGYYTCSTTEQRQEEDTDTVLSVITESEHRDGAVVTRSCTLWTVKFYEPTLKWMLDGKEVSGDHRQLKMSHSNSSVSFSFNDTDASSEFYRSLKCQVLDENEKQETEKEKEKPSTNTWSTKDLLLRHIIVSVGTAGLLICVAAVHIWARTKESQTERSPHRMSHRARLDLDNYIYEDMGEVSV